jgi:hypothetical protein
MDGSLSLQGRSSGVASKLRLIAVAALAAGLTACGGGGGGDDGGGGNPPTPTGTLRVTVTDTFDAPVASASVQATVGSATRSGTTAADGVVTITNVPTGSASVAVSRTTFVSQTVPATITENQTTELAVELVRATSAAGGSLTTRNPTGAPVVGGNGQTMTFEIELLVVGNDSQAIENLDAADFVLDACVPDTNTPRTDCIGAVALTGDRPYQSTTPTAQSASLIPGQAAQNYAAGLMLDQSQSISGSDPTGARLFSAKAFLDALNGGDWALLSAFANDGTNTEALIPTQPLTIYPPFRNSGTTRDSPSYYDTLDSLLDLVGGGTPLYESLDLLRADVVGDASVPAGIAKAVVIFTDGEDTDCGGVNTCRTRRDESILAAQTDDLRVFTIGLSSEVDFEALAELANETGGAFLFAESAEQLIPLYGTVGDLLSLSLPTYRLTFNVTAEEAGVFMSGRSLLGRVTVTAGGSTFKVPFIVGIP